MKRAKLFDYLVMMSDERRSMRNLARELYLIRTYYGSGCHKLFGYKIKGESAIVRARAEHHARCAGDSDWTRYTNLDDW